MSVLGPLATPNLSTNEPYPLGNLATPLGNEFVIGPAGTLANWAVPADGQYHQLVVAARKDVSEALTGAELCLDLYEENTSIARAVLFASATNQPPGAYMAAAVLLAKGINGTTLNLVTTVELSGGYATVALSLLAYR